MKKSLYIIITALLILSSFSACSETKDSENTSVSYESADTSVGTSANDDAPAKLEFSGDISIKKAGEGAEIGGEFTAIVERINNGEWIKGTPNGNYIYTIGANDKTIKYDKNGTFYIESEGLYKIVNDEDKTYLNETLDTLFDRIYEDW